MTERKAIEARHQPGAAARPLVCVYDHEPWPCDTEKMRRWLAEAAERQKQEQREQALVEALDAIVKRDFHRSFCNYMVAPCDCGFYESHKAAEDALRASREARER